MLADDADLEQKLATGFEGLWRKAMHDLREIYFHPEARRRILEVLYHPE